MSVEKTVQIDANAVKERLECDDELLFEIWEAFEEEAPQLNNALSIALAAGDLHLIERHAHTFKGMSGNIGADRLRSVAFEMESSAKNGDISAVRNIYPVLFETMNLVIAEIVELKPTS
jgi:HPt (histidine-containing phosphotransfer) domain-containing protein